MLLTSDSRRRKGNVANPPTRLRGSGGANAANTKVASPIAIRLITYPTRSLNNQGEVIARVFPPHRVLAESPYPRGEAASAESSLLERMNDEGGF